MGSRNIGEANKIFTVYTREMGLIRAIAQGVRLHKSKLRFSLQDFSYVKVDFVRGRDIWRITSAKSISSFAFARGDRGSILLIARVARLIERLCDGEENNEKIFDDFIQALYLLDDIDISKEKREALELHLVLRIMDSLGYIGESEIFKKYIGSSFEHSHIENLLKDRQSIITHINKALKESQL